MTYLIVSCHLFPSLGFISLWSYSHGWELKPIELLLIVIKIELINLRYSKLLFFCHKQGQMLKLITVCCLKWAFLSQDVCMCMKDIVVLLEDQLKPLVHAELSVLVDILHHPEYLFEPGCEGRRKCESGGFISK